MRLPRDLSAAELVKALEKFGYSPTRQTGSHLRLTTSVPVPHHITVPAHDPLRVGTLASIIGAVAQAQKLSRDEVLHRLFD